MAVKIMCHWHCCQKPQEPDCQHYCRPHYDTCVRIGLLEPTPIPKAPDTDKDLVKKR